MKSPGLAESADTVTFGGGATKLGLFTACLQEQSLEEIAAWAAGVGYQALEVAAWPPGSSRPFTPCHIDVTSVERGKELDTVHQYGLSISSLAYYENNLHPDAATRKGIHEHLLRTIDAAARIGCPTVGTFIGRDPTKTVTENLSQAEQIFRPIAEQAASQGVAVVIENCAMEGWHPDGYPGNLAYSPELWEWAFSLGLYLNFDPSHLAWLGIDPVAALRSCASKVAHVQAKDIEVFPDKRNHYGFFGRTITRENPWESGWWRYRIPGLGQISWPQIINVLHESGFTGVISVEHEDPVWEGSTENVKNGLKIAYQTLSPLITKEQNRSNQRPELPACDGAGLHRELIVMSKSGEQPRRRAVRSVAAASAVIACAAGLGACSNAPAGASGQASGQTPAGARQTITFATAALGAELQATKSEISSFEKAHPNITVQLQQLSSTSDQAYQQVTHYFIAARPTPDVIDADTAWPAAFAHAGWIIPLDTYVNRSALFPAAAAAGSYNSKLYAAMFYFNAEGLYYRSDLVKQAPKTPQQLVTDAETALKEDPNLKEGLAFEGSKYEGGVTVFIDLMGAFGGGLNPAHFDTPANLEALQFLHDVVYKYKIAPQAVTGWTEQNVQEAFTSGQAAFATNWPYVESMVNAGGSAVVNKSGFVPFPSLSGQGVATLASDALVINARSTHVPADAEFLNWLLSPAEQIARAITSGDPPSVQAAYTSQLFSKAPYFQTDLNVFKTGVPRLVSANYLQISADIQDMLSSVLANQASPAQALKSTAGQLAQLAQ